MSLETLRNKKMTPLALHIFQHRSTVQKHTSEYLLPHIPQDTQTNKCFI